MKKGGNIKNNKKINNKNNKKTDNRIINTIN